MEESAELNLAREINVQIETINYCNRRCEYCFFGHWEPLPPQVMSLDLYGKILDQVRALPVKTQLVAHSSYAEPTIDPFFIQRLEMLKERKMEYWNITNATHFTEEILDYLLDNLNLFRRFFLIDVPTVDAEEYYRMTGGSRNQAEKLREGLHRLGEHLTPKKIRAKLLVLGRYDAPHKQRHAALVEEFEKYGYSIGMAGLSDRGGELRPFIDNKVEHACVKGCRDKRFDGYLHFGVRGNLYLCCHDFTQRFSYGQASRSPLPKLLTGPRRQAMIQAMLGQMCRHCHSAIPC